MNIKIYKFTSAIAFENTESNTGGLYSSSNIKVSYNTETESFSFYIDGVTSARNIPFANIQDANGSQAGATFQDTIDYLGSVINFKTASGGSGASEWGSITGTLSNQADLNNRFVNVESGISSNTSIINNHESRVSDIESKYRNTTIISGNFSASQSAEIYSDNFVTIDWDGTFKQPTYTIPLSVTLPDTSTVTWGWHDISNHKLDGNSTSRRARQDDVSFGEGTFYFGQSGNRNANWDMENYGSVSRVVLTKESFDSRFPTYMMFIGIGSTFGQCWYELHIINNQNVIES